MTLLTALLIGFGCAFIGLVIPGMLTMTTVKLSLGKGKWPAILYGAGIATVYMIQVGVAVGLSSFVGDASQVIETMTKWSIALFSLLFLVFLYRAYTKEPEADETVEEEEADDAEASDFFNGMGVALINFVVIPAFFALSTYVIQSGWMEGDTWSRVLFAVGAGLGSFAIFGSYALLARWIEDHVQWVTDNINWLLAGIFFCLICFRAWKMFG